MSRVEKKLPLYFTIQFLLGIFFILLLQEINDERARDGKSRRKRDDADEKGKSGERLLMSSFKGI